MKETVKVEKLENIDQLKSYIEELFRKGLYDEINQAIGMHSLFIKPEYTRKDRHALLSYLLGLIKGKINKEHASGYYAWLSAFPKLLADIIANKSAIAGKASGHVLASRQSGYGPFMSLDDFFFWAMEDNRISLGDAVYYIEKTAELIK